MSNTVFNHADGWICVRDERTGLELSVFDDGELFVERFLPDEPEKSASAHIFPSLEDWKRIRDMADKNVLRMEQ